MSRKTTTYMFYPPLALHTKGCSEWKNINQHVHSFGEGCKRAIITNGVFHGEFSPFHNFWLTKTTNHRPRNHKPTTQNHSLSSSSTEPPPPPRYHQSTAIGPHTSLSCPFLPLRPIPLPSSLLSFSPFETYPVNPF